VCGGRRSEDLASRFRSRFPKKKYPAGHRRKTGLSDQEVGVARKDCAHEGVRTMVDKDLRRVAEWSRCVFEKEDAERVVHLKTVHANRVR
jgi:hypothetical protein